MFAAAMFKRLRRIERQLEALLKQGEIMAGEMKRLTDEVAETKTVMQSASTLLGKLSDLIRQNAGDPVALKALADDLDSEQAKLAAAITANTPADVPPPPSDEV